MALPGVVPFDGSKLAETVLVWAGESGAVLDERMAVVNVSVSHARRTAV